MPGHVQMLERMLDRTHLERNQPAPYPEYGVGYEVCPSLLCAVTVASTSCVQDGEVLHLSECQFNLSVRMSERCHVFSRL